MGARFSSFFRQCFPCFLLSPWSPSNSAKLPASSSPSRNEGGKYEVFISFRGSDVRRGFLSHLFAALQRKQIHAFIDDNLKRGEDIADALFQIIEDSNLSIVILSKNYPKSEWCLEELEKIHESMKQKKQIAVPVFYEVDPSHVQQLRGNYAIKVQKLRDALVEVSNLSGFDSNNYPNDANLIDAIVNDISKKLSDIYSSNSSNTDLFGIDSRIKDVKTLLCMDSIHDTRMVGIWGMGGIGKTTIARKVFDSIKKNFDGYCFVSNVRGTLSTKHEPADLRVGIIRELLRDKGIRMDSPSLDDDYIQRRLQRKKVLIVLDDVETFMQLKSLLEDNGLYSPYSFHPGSRIIVTSRDSQVLKFVNIKNYIYEVKQLKDDEALQLFSWHAFGNNTPREEYKDLSNKVVQYSRGVPLALVVLGCELRQKPKCYWKDALKKLSSTTPLEIQRILRISFDGLDRDEKKIFLDIACFFNRLSRVYVENILEANGFHASIGINRLIDKSLLIEEETEFDGVRITMHDLLEQMGKEIVVDEKQSHGRQHQSRIWTTHDFKDVLTVNKGTKDVEAISVRLWCDHGDQIDINSKAFLKMCKLRLLQIECPLSVESSMRLEYLPDSIRYLEWDTYPWSYFPSNYNPGKLVQLHLNFSNIEELVWNKPLQNLKYINLYCSKNLVRISGLSMAPNLEVIILSDCGNLVEMGSLHNLNKLKEINVRECISLSHLPKIPSSVKELYMEGSGLRKLPSTVGRLTHLKELSLESCHRLKSLPCSISELTSLERIKLRGCLNLLEIGFSLEHMKKLKLLDIGQCECVSDLPEIPSSIEELNLHGTKLSQLPSRFCSLTSLRRLNLSRCENLLNLPENFGKLESLEKLKASFTGLRELPSSLKNSKKLAKMKLTDCRELKSLPDLPPSLEVLNVRDCESLERVPTPFTSSISLDISGCPKLKASSIMAEHLQHVHQQPNEILDLCITGNEFPEWMKYRNNNGSDLCLEKESHGHSINLVFCAVVSSKKASSGYSPMAILRDGNGQDSYSICLKQVPFSREEIVNVFLWSCEIQCTFIKEVSFCFKSDNGKENNLEDKKITKCGVLPILKYEK